MGARAVTAVAGLLVLSGCGSGATADAPGVNVATSIAPPASGAPAASAVDWPFPTGVFRAEQTGAELFELHVAPGTVQLYDVADGTPELGYTARCVPAGAASTTCTERDGFQLVVVWGGTSDALELTVPDAAENHRQVWERTWHRVT